MSSKKTIAVVDAETDPFKKGRIPKPFIWGFYDGFDYLEFDDEISLIAHLFDKPIIVYAHNGGKFDWHFILDFIEPFTEVTIINGRIAKFYIGECEFRDSYNILPTALSAFKKDEIDYAIFEEGEREKPENLKRIKKYLQSDCVYLYQYITAFIDRFGMNLTLAGTAMKQWEKVADRKPPKDDGGLYDGFKRFYYGGRCQSFAHGVIDDKFLMVDINSAYPYSMLNYHPISLEFDEFPAADWFDMDGPGQGAAFVSLSAPSRGSLPYRGKDGALYFPDDGLVRDFDVTGWELLASLETGTIHRHEIELKQLFVFEELINFEDYVTHFFEEKSNAKDRGDVAGEIFAKLLLNSLYGKFGSNPDEYMSFQVFDPVLFGGDGEVEDEQGRVWKYGGDFGCHVLGQSELPDDEQRFYNVATAASITGYVRAFLWRAIRSCKGVVYCDTDSITARDIGDLPNGIGKQLGQWSSEGEFKRVALAGRKLYAMEYKEPIKDKSGNIKTHKIASKGARLDWRQIFDIANGAEILYEPESPVFSVHKGPHFINRRIKMIKKELQE